MRSQVLRLHNLRRLSVIFEVDGRVTVDVRAVSCLFSWIEAVTACKDLEGFHLSLSQLDNEYGVCGGDSDDEDEEEGSFAPWDRLLRESVIPSLLDLEAYFTSGTHFNRAPHVKISLKGGLKADINYVQSNLARLGMSGLDVIAKGIE
jgi:hypothetical protein